MAITPKEGEFHFYAATHYNWATASTRQEAITKVAIAAGKDTIERAKEDGKPGLVVFSTRIRHPESTSYSIWHYMPSKLDNGEPVKRDRTQMHYILNTKGHLMAHEVEE